MWRALLLATLLLSLAGCGNSKPAESEVPVTTIEGWVLDQVLRPVEDATVQWIGGNQTITDRNGHFVFQGLDVGTYTLRVTAEGMVPVARTVDIKVVGQYVLANFTMPHEVDTTPRIEYEQFDGFIECSGFVSAEHSHGGSGRPEGENPLDCGTYQTTESVWVQGVPAGIDAAVIEIVWDPGTDLAERLLVIVDQVMPDGTLDYMTFAEGPSPLKVSIPHLVALERFAENGQIQLDVQIGGSEDDVAAGLAFQQDFTAFTSYFWNQIPSSEYSIA